MGSWILLLELWHLVESWIKLDVSKLRHSCCLSIADKKLGLLNWTSLFLFLFWIILYCTYRSHPCPDEVFYHRALLYLYPISFHPLSSMCMLCMTCMAPMHSSCVVQAGGMYEWWMMTCETGLGMGSVSLGSRAPQPSRDTRSRGALRWPSGRNNGIISSVGITPLRKGREPRCKSKIRAWFLYWISFCIY